MLWGILPMTHSLQFNPPTFSKILSQAVPGSHPVGCKHDILSGQHFVWCLVSRVDIMVACPKSNPIFLLSLFQGAPPAPRFCVVWIGLTALPTSSSKGSHVTRSGQSIYPIFLPTVIRLGTKHCSSPSTLTQPWCSGVSHRQRWLLFHWGSRRWEAVTWNCWYSSLLSHSKTHRAINTTQRKAELCEPLNYFFGLNQLVRCLEVSSKSLQWKRTNCPMHMVPAK